MYRYINVGFGTLMIALSALSVVNPQGMLTVLMSPDYTVSVARVILASLLIAYSIFPSLRYNAFHKSLLVYVAGISWFIAFSVFTDGTRFPGPIDLFFGVQGAILSLIAYFDFARPKHVQKLVPQITIFELLLTRIKTFRAPALSSQRKHA